MSRRLTVGLTLLGSLLAACAAEPTEATWVTGFGFGWEAANHRLSRLDVPSEAGDVTVVGGASTTNVAYDDDGTCLDFDTCFELPFVDEATTFVERTSVRSDRASLATFEVELVADADGAEVVVDVPVARTYGTPYAWLAGWSLDTNTPHGEDSCYDPRHGWLPSLWSLSVEAGPVAGGAVPVTVKAAFASGLSLEDQRACLDAAAPGAGVRLKVQGVVAQGVDPWTLTTGRGASWGEISRNEADQPLSDLGDVTVELPIPEPYLAWSSFAFRFHEVVEPGRGAYLRSLELVADRNTAEVYGFATNASVTALSGFDMSFAGTTLVIDPAELGAD